MEAEARGRVLEQWYQRRRRELDEAGGIRFTASN